MAIVSVIKYEGDNQTFVWKHPKKDFNTGSHLIVHESQEAVFMLNGEAMDVFGPGSHILETHNLPIISSILKLATGGVSAFHAECYFINQTEQMAIKWGTDSKIQYMDPEYQFPLEIGASGQMTLGVADSIKLLVKLVGTEKILTREQLTTYFRAFILTRLKSSIPAIIIDKKISIFNIDQHLADISQAMYIMLVDDFIDYGIDLRRFLITTIVKPDEDPNYIRFKDLHFRNYTDIAEAQLEQKLALIKEQTRAQQTVIESEAIARKRQLEGYSYQQERSFEVASAMAANDAVAQMNNVGIGLGMMSGVGGVLGQQIGSMATEAVKETSHPTIPICTNCGHQLSAGALFCEKCGTKVQTKAICTNCGKELPDGANFCPICGARRTDR